MRHLSVVVLLACLGAFAYGEERHSMNLRQAYEFWKADLDPYLQFHNIMHENKPGERINLACNICKGVLIAFENEVAQEIPEEDLISSVNLLCKIIFPDQLCDGLVAMMVPYFYYVATNTNLVHDFICYGFTSSDDCDNPPTGQEWLVDLPAVEKPAVEVPAVPTNTPVTKFAHIADVHFDPRYEAGSSNNCDFFQCCQSVNGPGEGETAAGIWGDYGDCDIPLNVVENAFEHINTQHPDVEFIVFTGDIVAHDLWAQSEEYNFGAVDTIMNTFKAHFPDKPIFPVIGNHESFPPNIFNDETVTDGNLTTDNIFDHAWENWQTLLPADQEENVRRGGYYTTMIKDGLRAITFNNMHCYIHNWFTWMNRPDPNGELRWLADTLQMAETNGEKVYLFGHIPPGTRDCFPTYSHNFARIVNRYESTIMAQFYGHTHTDEMNIFYDSADPTRATNVAYVTPSLTTWTGMNPTYRIFHADGTHNASTHMILDHETWTYDVAQANLNGAPTWFQYYTAKSTFEVTDMSPQSLSDYSVSLQTDDLKWYAYYERWHKSSPVYDQVCRNDCKKDILCFLVRADSSDASHCNFEV